MSGCPRNERDRRARHRRAVLPHEAALDAAVRARRKRGHCAPALRNRHALWSAEYTDRRRNNRRKLCTRRWNGGVESSVGVGRDGERVGAGNRDWRVAGGIADSLARIGRPRLAIDVAVDPSGWRCERQAADVREVGSCLIDWFRARARARPPPPVDGTRRVDQVRAAHLEPEIARRPDHRVDAAADRFGNLLLVRRRYRRRHRDRCVDVAAQALRDADRLNSPVQQSADFLDPAVDDGANEDRIGCPVGRARHRSGTRARMGAIARERRQRDARSHDQPPREKGFHLRYQCADTTNRTPLS